MTAEFRLTGVVPDVCWLLALFTQLVELALLIIELMLLHGLGSSIFTPESGDLMNERCWFVKLWWLVLGANVNGCCFCCCFSRLSRSRSISVCLLPCLVSPLRAHSSRSSFNVIDSKWWLCFCVVCSATAELNVLNELELVSLLQFSLISTFCVWSVDTLRRGALPAMALKLPMVELFDNELALDNSWPICVKQPFAFSIE